MPLVRVYGAVVHPHGDTSPTPVVGDGTILYQWRGVNTLDGAVHGGDRHVVTYTGGVADDAWLRPGAWTAQVNPTGGHGSPWSMTLGIPDDATAVTLADALGVVVDDRIVTKGEPGEAGPAGASIVGATDNGDGTLTFLLSDGSELPPVDIPPGPAGRGITSISDPDGAGAVTITYSDGTTSTVQAIRGADGHTPVLTWDGTVLVVDGVPGPDLKGEPGADSTVPGPAGPPGAVPTASDYLVVGPGRPDAPTTTGLTAAQINALPVGAEYRSTDGASVGAWVWRKRPTGWVVTEGDTGWVSAGTITKGGTCTVSVKRAGNSVTWRFAFDGVEITTGVATGSIFSRAGFVADMSPHNHLILGAPVYANIGNNAVTLMGHVGVLWNSPTFAMPSINFTSGMARQTVATVSHPSAATWPTTLTP